MKNGLEITTTMGCINSCSYCPQSTLVGVYSQRTKVTILSFEIFTKIADKLPKLTTLYFAGFSEPFQNAECSKMILYGEKKNFAIQVYTTLIGINEKIIDEIKNVNFELFTIHLPDNKGLTKIKVDDTYLKNLEYLMDSNIHNLAFHYHSQNGEISPKIGSLLRKYNINIELEGKTWDLTTRAGNLDTREHKTGSLARCPRLNRNVLLPNGDIALCCMDFGLKHILGNLITMEFTEMYNSPEFMAILAQLTTEDSDILCRTCELARR